MLSKEFKSEFPKSAGPKEVSCKILFGPINFVKIQNCLNRQAWLKRAFGPAKLFYILESLVQVRVVRLLSSSIFVIRRLSYIFS